MTMAVERTRVTDMELNAIAARLERSTPPSTMNDDGLRNWYPNDVGSLMQEVLALRQDGARVHDLLATNPALDEDARLYPSAWLAQRLNELWAENQAGLWRKAQYARLKERLDETTAQREQLLTQLTRSQDRVASLEAEADLLRSQLVSASDQLNGQRVAHEAERSKLAQVADRASQERDAMRVEATTAIAATTREYGRRATIARDLLLEAGAALDTLPSD